MSADGRSPITSTVVTVPSSEWPGEAYKHLSDGYELEAYSTCWDGRNVMHSAVFIKWTVPIDDIF